MNNQDQMKSMEENIVNQINYLKDEIINLKEIYKMKMKSWGIDVNNWKNDAQSTSQTIMLWHSMVDGTT